MSNNAMSNEIDLDWLVRNVHEWPTETDFVFVGTGIGHGNMGWYPADYCFSKSSLVTKQQWLARRAELQNKPSWEDAPEWVDWLAQDKSGAWWFFRCHPKAMSEWWDSDSSAYHHSSWVDGKVLGDWRDTLEKRPVDLSSAAVIERLDEATQNVLAAVPGLMDEKYSFEPEFKQVSVSNETVQLERPIAVAGTGNGSATESAFLIGRVIDLLRTSVDHFSADELAELNELTGAELTKRDSAVCGGQKYLDAHWFERGELPPVGSSVTVDEVDGLGLSDLGREFVGEECKVMAAFTRPELSHSDAVDVVVVMEQGGGCCCFVLEMIRPIRTERDELVNVFINHYGNPKGAEGYIGIADAILAAGFSLRGK